MSASPSGLLTTEDVARYCGVTLKTAADWLRLGRLPSQQNNQETKVLVPDLVSFMQAIELAVPVSLVPAELAAPLINPSKVLVVDEDTMAANMVERVLRSMGLEVMQANNAYDAGVTYIRRKPHLMTLDLNLEGMDGVALINNIRSTQTHKAKILVLTNSLPGLMAKAKTVGADAILSKPYDNDSLRRNVRILLGL